MTINQFKQEGLSDANLGFCATAAGRNLDGLRAAPAAGRVVRQRLPAYRQPQVSAWAAVRVGERGKLGDGPSVFSQQQNHPAPPQDLAGAGLLPKRLETVGGTVRGTPRHQLGQSAHRRFQTQSSKRGEATGPSPVDRAKCGTAIHLATDERGMPLGATVTVAAANDGQQTQQVLCSMVVQPPPPAQSVTVLDPLNLPSAKADGAYGNAPTAARATAAGFRMRAPRRGQARLPGVGRIRCAVERGHAFLSQFGRVARRYDRSARRYLGWIELAACVIFVRSGFVP